MDRDEDDGAASGNGDRATSWLSSVKSFFDDTVDEQRIERLRACRVLEDTLAECQRSKRLAKGKSGESSSSATRLHLEDTPPGIRMVRYFQWRDEHTFDKKCSREAHAMWACRAGALQCGSELVQLRNCFLDKQATTLSADNANDVDSSNVGAVLSCSVTAYEPKERHAERNIPCRLFQEQVGTCVAKNALLLAQRESSRGNRAKTIDTPRVQANETV